GREHAVLKGHRSWINSITFSTDGRLLATGSSDGTLKLWDASKWQEQLTFSAGDGEIRSVAFAPDGKTLAAGTRYGKIVRGNLATRQESARLTGHAGDVWAVAFSPDGKILASGDGDWNQPGGVKLWGVATWRERVTLPHTGEVLCLAF